MPQQPATSFADDLTAVRDDFSADLKAAREAVEAGQSVPHPLVAKLLEWLPTGEALVGGAVGAAAGAPAGPPGMFAGGVAGAMAGGAAGEAQRQLANRALGNPAPGSAQEAAAQIGQSATLQGEAEAGGQAFRALSAPVGRYLAGKAKETMVAALGPAGRGTGPPGREMLATAKKVAPGLLERRFGAFTHPAALEKVGKAIGAADQAIDDLMTALPPGQSVSTKTIIDTLETAKRSGTVGGVAVGAGEVANGVIDTAIDWLKKIGPQMTPEQAVRFRQLIGPLAKWSALNPASENLKAEAYQTVYNGVRDAIEHLDPKIGPANQEIHFWLNVQKVLNRVSERPQAPSSGTSGAILGGMLEASHGGSRVGVLSAAVMGRYLQRALRSPGWRFASANLKNDLAKAITDGRADRVAAITAKIAAGQAALMSSHEQEAK